jgi:hypothetical protein
MLQRLFAILLTASVLLGASMTQGQVRVVDVDAPQGATRFTPEDLDTLVGAIALYADPLIAQILPASTFPVDIVKAARLVRAGATAEQIDQQDWDPSVKAIAHYPTVLEMMDSNIEWTQQLGEAFIAQPDDLMQAVQRQRKRASDLGNLVSTPQQQVVVEAPYIYIVPAAPEVIYVPVYQPEYVYYQAPLYGPYITFGSPCFLGPWLDLGCYWGYGFVFHLGWTWDHWHDHIVIDHAHFTYFHRPDVHVGEHPTSAWHRDPARPLAFQGQRLAHPSDFDRYRGREARPGEVSRRHIETPRPAPDRGIDRGGGARPPVPLTPSQPGTDPRRAQDRGTRSLSSPSTQVPAAPGPSRPAPTPTAPTPAPGPTRPAPTSAPAKPTPAPAPPNQAPGQSRPVQGPTRPVQSQPAPARIPTPPVRVAPPPTSRPAAPPFTGPAGGQGSSPATGRGDDRHGRG